MQLAAALSMHNTHASAGGCISPEMYTKTLEAGYSPRFITATKKAGAPALCRSHQLKKRF